MKASEIAAWWGAIIATIVLGWDIYKWKRSRSNIQVHVSSDMQTVASNSLQDDKNIFVEVVNRGDKVSTITKLFVKHYRSIFHRIINKHSMQGIIINPIGYTPLPYELGPGKRWTGCIDQYDIEEKMGNKGILYCGVIHSLSNKAEMVKVK